MKRVTLTPGHAFIKLFIPKSFIGKKVKITYMIEEVIETAPASFEPVREKPSDFKGIISKETAERLLKTIEESRNEWREREDKQWSS